jgi:hypothetical protein
MRNWISHLPITTIEQAASAIRESDLYRKNGHPDPAAKRIAWRRRKKSRHEAGFW